MREAEAAQGQAGKVTTHLPGGPALAYLSPSAQLHYCHCLFNTHGLGYRRPLTLRTKEGIGAWAALTTHPHFKSLLCQTPPLLPDDSFRSSPVVPPPAFPLSSSGDETYLDIFRDFSLMASDDPEKLSRRSHDLHTL